MHGEGFYRPCLDESSQAWEMGLTAISIRQMRKQIQRQSLILRSLVSGLTLAVFLALPLEGGGALSFREELHRLPINTWRC